MRKVLTLCLLALPLVAMSQSATQVNPARIAWPTTCTVGQVYSPNSNTCVAPSTAIPGVVGDGANGLAVTGSVSAQNGNFRGTVAAGTTNGTVNAAMQAGATTNTKVAAAISGISGAGIIEIPSTLAIDTMPTTGQYGVSCWDYRSTPATGGYTGWPSGGVLLSDCSNDIASNYFYLPTHGRFTVGSSYHADTYPSATYGVVGVTSWQMIDGTVPSTGGSANDGSASIIWGKQGLNTSLNRAYVTGAEDEAIIQGTGAGSTLGTHMDVYSLRAATFNIASVDSPSLTDIAIGDYRQLASQQVTFTPASTWHFGRLTGIHAAPPGVLPARVYLSGTASVVNGQSVITRVSGDYFNDEAMLVGMPIMVGGVAYWCNGSVDSTHLNLGSVYGGSTATVAWSFNGSQYSFESLGNTHLDTTNTGLATDPVDPLGGGGVIVDTAYNLTSVQSRQFWIRNATPNNYMSDGTYYRMSMFVDPSGYLHLAKPLTSSTQSDVCTLNPNGVLTCIGGFVGTNQPSTFGEVTISSGLTVNAASSFTGNIVEKYNTTHVMTHIMDSSGALHFQGDSATDMFVISQSGDLVGAGSTTFYGKQNSPAQGVSSSAGTIIGSDSGGKVTGLSAATSVTVTFAFNTWTTYQSCTASPSVSLAAAPYVSAISASSVTFSFPSLTGALYYQCSGN